MTSGELARAAAADWPRWMRAETAIRYLDLPSSDALYRLVQAGLPCVRVGHGRGVFRFDRLRLDSWLEERALHVATVGGGR